MKGFFPPYLLKSRAIVTMRGRFFKVAAIVFIPISVLAILMLGLYLFLPGIKEGFELVLTGNFAGVEERIAFANELMNKYFYAGRAIYILFGFLELGSVSLLMDMLRGKEVKIKDIFKFYDKWYVYAAYLGIMLLINAGFNMLGGYMGKFYFICEILYFVLTCKLLFVENALCDNNCTSLWGAVKTSFKMTDVSTVMNYILLGISFIGWMFLGAFTMGIVYIYAIPYMTLAAEALYVTKKEVNVTDN